MKMMIGVVVIAALAGGCTSSQALLSDDPGPRHVSLGTEAGTAANADASIPGARTVELSQVTYRSVGPVIYNSDNRGTVTRSGLGSNPDNPSGMPGR